ncbi:hypothetical protein SAMD00019534_083900 [Acytostelium subglobosum LB1]|uniref:hypothetical protein n=1 Tax=Acytostelium subglobosum LB1 TaxID=1410327 RepID=UPI000644F031|nr:hypothetical protein SAMD00019534_083900 [Acytostelium subglobosum LB1]GAM25215.1 hypothetical protein SAMD00019534_083900 [Acytostelium subglobosum LB1]|eukprot:XP_012751735.1 hypothetical protein SAMD00019534_083900 [Acytostelium subglobosum LB1]
MIIHRSINVEEAVLHLPGVDIGTCLTVNDPCSSDNEPLEIIVVNDHLITNKDNNNNNTCFIGIKSGKERVVSVSYSIKTEKPYQLNYQINSDGLDALFVLSRQSDHRQALKSTDRHHYTLQSSVIWENVIGLGFEEVETEFCFISNDGSIQQVLSAVITCEPSAIIKLQDNRELQLGEAQPVEVVQSLENNVKCTKYVGVVINTNRRLAPLAKGVLSSDQSVLFDVISSTTTEYGSFSSVLMSNVPSLSNYDLIATPKSNEPVVTGFLKLDAYQYSAIIQKSNKVHYKLVDMTLNKDSRNNNNNVDRIIIFKDCNQNGGDGELVQDKPETKHHIRGRPKGSGKVGGKGVLSIIKLDQTTHMIKLGGLPVLDYSFQLINCVQTSTVDILNFETFSAFIKYGRIAFETSIKWDQISYKEEEIFSKLKRATVS